MPTADQVFVEIRATVDQHIAATKRVADATQRDMARVEGSVTGAAKAEVAAFDQVAQGAERSAQRVAAAGRAAAGAGRPSGAGGIQNTANQLQDFIVQVSSGTSVLRAFGQQAPQLLSGFGPWGAVLGIAAAGVGVLATALGGFENAADRAKEAQKAFDTVMKDTKGSLTESEKAALELASSLSLVERGLLNIAAQEIDSAIRKQKDALKALTDEAKSSAGNLQAAFEAQQIDVGGTNAVPSALLERFKAAVADLNATANPTSEQLNKVLGIIREIGPAFALSGVDINKSADALGEAGKQAATLETNVAAANKVQERLTTIANENAAAVNGAGKTMENLGLKAGTTAQQIISLAQAMKIWNDEATRSRSAGVQAGVDFDKQLAEVRAQTDAYKKGKDAVDAHADAVKADALASAASEAARKQGLNSNDQRAAADEARAAVLEEGRQKRAFDAREKAAREAAAAAKRGGGAAARLEARTDSALTGIQQQVDLNKQLIAVYNQGPEALARQKAAYDALNSARQLGYKIGTAEHSQYVQRYQDIAEQKRQTDVVLADYAKAADLVKGARTAQETYNATLADYKRYREEGAITDQQYLVLVKKLDAENNGYAEGIQAVGQAIQGGIQGATDFNDALIKIGLQLATLTIQALAFGNSAGGGPLGKLFDSLLGLSGGLLGNLGGGSTAAPGIGSPGTGGSMAAAYGGARAQGGQAIPGKIYPVGETGLEWFAPTVPGQVISNSVIKNAARGGGGGADRPIQIFIPLAGANGDRTIAAIVTAGVKKGLAQVPNLNRQHDIRYA